MAKRRSKEELSNNFDKMSKALNSMTKELDKVVDRFEDMSKISKDVEQIQKSITTQLEKQTKEAEENNKNLLNQKKAEYEKLLKQNQRKYTTNTVPKSLNDWFNTNSYNIKMQKALEKYTKEAQYTALNDSKYVDSNGRLNDKGYEYMTKYITEHLDETSENLSSASKEFSLKTKMFSIAVDTFQSIISTFYNLFKSGMNRQSQVFENTFENISVRTGLTKDQYFNAQSHVNNALSDRALRENIATSEVQQMWNTMAQNGFMFNNAEGKYDEAELIAESIDNVLTSKIVPYLDVSTKESQLLNSKLNGDFFKQVRGIGIANQEIAGGNYATQDLLNTIIDQVQPMSDEALENLAQGSSEVTAMINKMVASGTMDYDTAKSYATQVFKTQRYSDQIMSSGSTAEKMSLINSMNAGLNYYNPEDWNDIIGQQMDVDRTISSWTNGYGSTMSGIMTNKVGSAMGVDYGRMNAGLNMTNAGVTGSQLAQETNLTAEELEQYINQAEESFANDENQTAEQIQNNIAENLSNELAVLNEKLGVVGDAITKALEDLGKAIITFIGAEIVKGVIGKAAGIVGGASAGGVGAGFAGILATGGGILLGIGAANVIKGAIAGAFKKEDNHNTTAEAEALKGTKLEGNTAAEILGGMATTDQSENNNFGSKLGSAWNTTTRWLGVGTLGWTRDVARINKDDLGFFREKVRTLGGGPTKDAARDALLVWTLLLASANRLSDIEEFNGITNESLKQMVEASGVAPSSWDKYLNETVKKIGYLPNKTEKEDQTTIDWGKLGINYHRQGLDDVPYDNYLASLHEGEAVLTASTANELRNLLDEYRSNTAQVASLDAIIQNQTVELVSKLDEIIETIVNYSSANAGTLSASRMDQATLKSKLQNSMTHLTNTKSMQ